MNIFNEIKSQAEIDIEEMRIPAWIKLYFMFSFGMTFVFSILVVLALLKWIFL